MTNSAEILHFSGPAVDRGGQLCRVYEAMRDGRWRTLYEVACLTSDPTQSVSARLRDFRKTRFGGHTVNRRELRPGLFEYQLLPRVTA